MDPHSFIARAEAQRWLGIAEKLLLGRDLVGSKTFAIRAREADPRLEPAEQILAIADTLLAAEKRVGNNNNHPDWYSILQLVRLTHDSELIASQYRRLALLLNPNKSQLPYADQAFQLVSEAWSVLSNPMRKSIYDSELNFPQQFNPIGFTREVPQPQQHHQQPQQQHQQQQQQHNFFSPPNVVGSGREQERPERPFVIRPHQQHNFLSQPNLVGSGREPEQPVRPPFQSKPTQQQQPPQQQQQRQPPQVQQRPPPPPPPPSQSQQPQPQPQIQPNPQPPPPPAPPQPQQPTPPPPPQQQSQERNSHSPAPRENSNGVREEREMDGRGNVDGSSKFWTACPFCFNMYEYFRVYAECTLRCQNCKRAFQAVAVQSPPLVSEGKEAYYYCWGFFPFGISMASLEKNKGKGSNWTPFSPMFAAPNGGFDGGFQENVKPRRNYYTGPRTYIDDVVDDVFVGVSEPSEDSDIEWGSTRKKKKAKKVKGIKRKGMGRKRIKKAKAAKTAQGVIMGNGENLGDGFPVQEGVVVPNVPVAETSKRAETSKKAESTKKAVGAVPRRQSGRVAKELGKLDLNVEFNNNDGEEPAPGMTAGNRGGHREEDNIEGIGFFEGLDEFLSSLPILSVVGDDKVKAA